jgi:hypothetical protein
MKNSIKHIRIFNIVLSRIILPFFILQLFPYNSLQTEPLTISPRLQHARGILERYFPDGKEIIDRVLEINREPYNPGAFLKNSPDSEKFLIDMSVMVHESCHYYSLLTDPSADTFFIHSNQIITIPRTTPFNSREIIPLIPRTLRGQRFETYLMKDAQVAQLLGIYGLLNEWNAYLQGMRTVLALKKYIDAEKEKSEKYYAIWVSLASNTALAHYEFKYWSLLYLMHARNRHPEQYGNFRERPALIHLMQTVNESFEAEIQNFSLEKELLAQELKLLHPGGIYGDPGDGVFRFGNRGIGTSKKEIEILNTELTDQKFDPVKKDFSLL